jgi:hypothetical protein
MDWIPVCSDAIDPVWLTEALTPRYAGVRVARVEVSERVELTNHHALLRITYDASAGAPEAMFCKFLPSDPGLRAAVAGTGMGPREARFYNQLASALSLRTPVPYVSRHDDRDGSFVLVLEDLVAAGCTIPDGVAGVTPEAAAVALEDLARLHLRFADASRRKAEASWVPPPMHDPSYGSALLKVGLDLHRDRLTPEFAQIAQCYIDAPDAMHVLWQEGPTTVIHGDPHIGNLFDDHGRTGFLDWGIISTGTPLRDVSYFLNLALAIADRRRNEEALLRHYLDVWNASAASPIGFDDAWRSHRIQTAYTVLACCQIVTFPENTTERQRIFSEAFLARAAAAIADLDSFSALKAAGL